MRYRAPVVAAIAFTLLLSTRLGFAKGPPDRIIISGGGVAHPIEITDSLSRLQFNPWAAAFANLHSPVRDSSTCALAPYDVRFYALARPARRLRPRRQGVDLCRDLLPRVWRRGRHVPSARSRPAVLRHQREYDSPARPDGRSFPATIEWNRKFAELIGTRG